MSENLALISVLGGVVTFTARVVAEKPAETAALIAQINEHPNWVCYVIPEVLGLLQDMATADDPSLYSTAEFSEYVDHSSFPAAINGPSAL